MNLGTDGGTELAQYYVSYLKKFSLSIYTFARVNLFYQRFVAAKPASCCVEMLTKMKLEKINLFSVYFQSYYKNNAVDYINCLNC